MDDADEFFDCDNDYSAPVNDTLFDSLADGLAGFSLATPKHQGNRPSVKLNSQAPSRLSQGSPLKSILNNRGNILANLSPNRQRELSSSTTLCLGQENASPKSRSPLKSRESSNLSSDSTFVSIPTNEDEENVFVDASSRSESPTIQLEEDGLFARFASLNASVAQDSFTLDNIEELLLTGKVKTPRRSECKAAANATFELENDASRTEASETKPDELAALNETLVVEPFNLGDKSLDKVPSPAVEKSEDTLLKQVLDGKVVLKTPLENPQEGFHYSPELLAMKALLRQTESSVAELQQEAVEKVVDLNPDQVGEVSDLPDDTKTEHFPVVSCAQTECSVSSDQPSSVSEAIDNPSTNDLIEDVDMNSTFSNGNVQATIKTTHDEHLEQTPEVLADVDSGLLASEVANQNPSTEEKAAAEPCFEAELNQEMEVEVQQDEENAGVIIEKGYAYLDGMDPFASSGGIPNSPPIVSHKGYSYTDGMDPFGSSSGIANSPVSTEITRGVRSENSDLNSTFEKETKEAGCSSNADTLPISSTDALIDHNEDESTEIGVSTEKPYESLSVQNSTELKNVGYSFDENVNPFTSKGGILNSPGVLRQSATSMPTSTHTLDSTFEMETEPREDVPEGNGESEAAKSPGTNTKVGTSIKNEANPLAAKGGIEDSPRLVEEKAHLFSKLDLDGTYEKDNGAVELEKSRVTDIEFVDTIKLASLEPGCPEAEANEEIEVPKVNYNFDDCADPFAPKGGLANSPTNSKMPPSPMLDLNGTFEKKEAMEIENPFVAEGGLLNIPVSEGGIDAPASDLLSSTFSCEDRSTAENVADIKSDADMSVPSESLCSEANENTYVDTPKGSYTFDACADPFASKGGLANSPSTRKIQPSSTLNLSGTLENCGAMEMEDSFAPKVGLSNSPDKGRGTDLLSTTFPREEPSSTEKKSDVASANADAPSSPKSLCREANENVEMEVPKRSYTYDESADPFASKGGLANSPTKDAAPVPKASYTFDENADPFASKGGLATSPIKEKVESAPSPAIKSAKKKRGKKGNKKTPTKSKETAETAVSQLEDKENPFASKGGISKSPANPVANPTRSASQPEKAKGPKVTGENPFVTKTKVATSPSTAKADTSRASELALQEEKNPFEMKTNMANSPIALKPMEEEECPFVTTTKMANSPIASKLTGEDENPFVTKTKMANSPIASKPMEEDENPFVTKTKMANSPQAPKPFEQEENPFVTKAKMANSPIASERDKNPFVTKSKMGNSPMTKKLDSSSDDARPDIAKTDSADSTITNNIEEDKENREHDEAPNETKKPTGKGKSRPKSKMREMMEMKRKQMQQQNGIGDIMEDVVVEPPPAPVKEISASEDERAPLPDASTTDDFGFSDADFKSSDEFLRDPSAFDVLANIGADKRISMSQSRLARDSLYVKFDPLMSSSGSTQPPSSTFPVSNTTSTSMPPPSGTPGDPSARKPSADLDSPRESMILIGTPPAKHKDQSVKLSARKDTNLARARETDSENVRSGVDLLSGSPVRAAGGASKVARNLAKDVEEQKTFDIKVRDLELDFQSRMLQREKEFADDRKKMQQKEGKLKAEIAKKLKENSVLTQDMAGMKSIVEGFETTIQELMKGQDDLRKEKEIELEALKKEKEAATEETASVEKAFSDLHKRFDKARELIEGFKKNEQALKDYAEDSRVKLEKQMEKYSTLKKHAEEKIELANKTIGDERKAAGAEQTRLKAAQKLLDIKVSKLQKQVEDKTKENEELTAICDELLSKVGST